MMPNEREPRPRWTLKLHDSYSEQAWMILHDGVWMADVCGPKAGKEMVAGLNAAETLAAQAGGREAALREAAAVCEANKGGKNCYWGCHNADRDAILALIGQPARAEPNDR